MVLFMAELSLLIMPQTLACRLSNGVNNRTTLHIYFTHFTVLFRAQIVEFSQYIDNNNHHFNNKILSKWLPTMYNVQSV